jgi:hypothetical protein
MQIRASSFAIVVEHVCVDIDRRGSDHLLGVTLLGGACERLRVAQRAACQLSAKRAFFG